MPKSLDQNLKTIIDKYEKIEYSNDNYYLGGGLSEQKFASVRHEDAKNDKGKLTLGEATSLFERISGLKRWKVKEVILNAIPYRQMEWHHAGKLPKSYGGGMKKTFFLDCLQICTLAKEWKILVSNYEEECEKHDKLVKKRKKILTRAEHFCRVTNLPKNSYVISTEMKGKYGWFECEGSRYNLQKYYSGYSFKTKKMCEKYKYLMHS
ncbi:MAG: hypothetical protein CMC13_06685 [Flavobacteriaceae bacterium]|nr:hypothetical protein [Flavobacteriaceae bacterium]|tara:strand:+ start:151 stop:774 length:624 start_codon:yes stop_codon:yes gene_type:complete